MYLAIATLEKNIIEDGQQKVLQISFEGLELVDFQLEMINSHKDRGLVGVEKLTFNNEVHLKYQISELKNLYDYIKENKTDNETLIKIFSDIGDIVLNCKDLLLQSENFLLEKDNMYIDTKNNSIKLINIPLADRYNENINERYMELISDLTKSMLIDSAIQAESAGFVMKVRDLLIEKLNITEFIEKINTINVNLNQKSAKVQQQTPPPKPPQVPSPKPSVKTRPITEPAIKEIPITPVKKTESSTVSNSPKDISNTGTKVITKKKYKTSRLVTTIIFQPIFIGIILALTFIPETTIVQVGGGGLLLLVLDGIIVKNLLDPSKKQEVKVDVRSSNTKQTSKKTKENKKQPPTKQPVQSKSVHQTHVSTPVAIPNNIGNGETDILDDNSTTYLGATGYLEIQTQSGAKYRKDITTDNFVIGRQAELSQYMASKNIGRQHAQIYKANGEYYIKDLKSKNGTILNGARLNSEECLPLKDSDVITLPELTCIFKLY